MVGEVQGVDSRAGGVGGHNRYNMQSVSEAALEGPEGQ